VVVGPEEQVVVGPEEAVEPRLLGVLGDREQFGVVGAELWFGEDDQSPDSPCHGRRAVGPAGVRAGGHTASWMP
jgi:hypothetical protein